MTQVILNIFRKLNLTTVVALAFLSKAGYGMDLGFSTDASSSVHVASGVDTFNNGYFVTGLGVQVLPAEMRKEVLPLFSTLYASCKDTVLYDKISNIVLLMAEEPKFKTDGSLAEEFVAPYREIVDYAKSDDAAHHFKNEHFNQVSQMLALRTTPSYYLRNLKKLVAIPESTLHFTKHLIVSILKAQVGNKAERLEQIERALGFTDRRSTGVATLMNSYPSVRDDILGLFHLSDAGMAAGGGMGHAGMAGAAVTSDDAAASAPLPALRLEELPESAKDALSILGLQTNEEVLTVLALLPREELEGFFNEAFLEELLSSAEQIGVISAKVIRLTSPRK